MEVFHLQLLLHHLCLLVLLYPCLSHFPVELSQLILFLDKMHPRVILHLHHILPPSQASTEDRILQVNTLQIQDSIQEDNTLRVLVLTHHQVHPEVNILQAQVLTLHQVHPEVNILQAQVLTLHQVHPEDNTLLALVLIRHQVHPEGNIHLGHLDLIPPIQASILIILLLNTPHLVHLLDLIHHQILVVIPLMQGNTLLRILGPTLLRAIILGELSKEVLCKMTHRLPQKLA